MSSQNIFDSNTITSKSLKFTCKLRKLRGTSGCSGTGLPERGWTVLACYMSIFDLFVCLGLTSLWNIWGHITTVPACSSGALTNVLPHRNAMPQTQDTTPHPVTVYRHGANLSLCYLSMWNVTLEYTATHFNVLGETRPGNPSPTFHTHQRTFNLMLSWWSTVGSSVESTVPTGSWTRDLWCANPVRYPLAHSDFHPYLIYLTRSVSACKRQAMFTLSWTPDTVYSGK